MDRSHLALEAVQVPWRQDVEVRHGYYVWLAFDPDPRWDERPLRFMGKNEGLSSLGYEDVEIALNDEWLRRGRDTSIPEFMVVHGIAPMQLFCCYFRWEGAFNPLEGVWDGELVPYLALIERLAPEEILKRWESCLALYKEAR